MNRPTAAACAALAAVWTLTGATATQPDPWPQRITDDMTAVQVTETSLATDPAAYERCLGYAAAYDADASRAPHEVPAGMPAHMTTADACGTTTPETEN